MGIGRSPVRLGPLGVFWNRNHVDAVFSKPQSGFECFNKASAILFRNNDSILNDLNARTEALDFLVRIDAHDFVVDPATQIALLLDEIEKLARFRFGWNGDPEVDQHIFARELLQNMIGDRLGGFGANFPTAVRTKCAGHTRPEQFQVIVNLGHGADGGARTLDRVRLFDGDGGRDATNVVDARLVHTVEKLPHVRAERLDVAALAFGVYRFKGERRFAAAARTSDDGQLAEGKIDIYALEIVLTRPPNLDATRCGNAFFFSNLGTH